MTIYSCSSDKRDLYQSTCCYTAW